MAPGSVNCRRLLARSRVYWRDTPYEYLPLMSKSSKPRDPFANREASNYSNPIASRELILETLEDIGEPASLSDVAEKLQLSSEEELEALRRRLIAMTRDGQIISNRRGVYGLAAHMGLERGRIQGNKDGFGFFIPEDGGDDLFLSPREMEKLFDGDIVLARHSGFDNRGRKEGMVVEILTRRYSEIVGRYYQEQGFGLVIPDSKRIAHEILIPDGQSRSASDGQYVVAELVEYPDKRRKAIGKITEILGDVSTPGLEIDIAVRSHNIPHEWPADVEKETARLPNTVSDKELKGRYDLRDIPFVTIDGEDAKDFDDAVYARQHKSGGWTLMVAIADVSAYVTVGSALDTEATERGTSVYFPGHVIPMLPEELSNGLCSLKPEVDRLTMVCEMEISTTGEMTDFNFFEGVIHSHARLTYNEVADMLSEPANDTTAKLRDKLRKRHEALIGDLDNLYSLYHVLRERRANNGAMDFESTETRIVFGEDRKIREIVPVQRNEAHRLIEECMLCANVAAANLLEAHKLPTLYRVHEGPNPDKLDSLREFLGGLGLHLGGGEKPSPLHYQSVLQSLSDRPNSHLLQVMLIRSMMQAVYTPDNAGHFGLGFEAYAHFTSPIRRYPDLLVHRGIRYLLRNKKGKHLRPHKEAAKLDKQVIYPYGETDMAALGESCSNYERRADAASYSVVDWLKCEYMQDRVGDDFLGTVASVTSFGLFIELADIFIEGLVHISELSNDYYNFDPVHQCLQGERSGVRFAMGDTVEVKLVRVDLNDKKIDLQMLRKVGGDQPVPTGDAGARRQPNPKKAGKKARNSGKQRTSQGKAPDKTAGGAQAKAGKKKRPASKSKGQSAAGFTRDQVSGLAAKSKKTKPARKAKSGDSASAKTGGSGKTNNLSRAKKIANKAKRNQAAKAQGKGPGKRPRK